MINRQILIVLIVTVITIFSSNSNGSPLEHKIVKATNANDTNAPFIVSLQYYDTHYCTGSILNAHWIITAAHCLASKDQVLNSTLVAGSLNIDDTVNTTQKRSIDNYVVNELYFGGTSPFDIGLVYTSTPLTWTTAVAPITLPEIDSNPSGDAFLYGWNKFYETNSSDYPKILQMTKVLIISHSICLSKLYKYESNLQDTNLCTEPLTNDVDNCASDSGGPLVQNVNGEYVLIGILSWGQKQCAQSVFPTVYVKVSSFITWIVQNQIRILKEAADIIQDDLVNI